MKTRIAVFLGGRSPEHDVSVVTGLQALQALDQTRFEPFVVYVTTDGDWLVGPGLDDRRSYIPDAQIRAKLSEVTLDLAAGGWSRARAGCSRASRRSSSTWRCWRFTGSAARTGSSRGSSRQPTSPIPACA